MTIREKITTLGLGPEQTRQVYLILCNGFLNGAASMAVYLPHMSDKAIADLSEKAFFTFLDRDLPECLTTRTPENAVFDKAFSLDFSNDLP